MIYNGFPLTAHVMKLQRTPLILLLIALLFGSVVLIYETQGKPRQEMAETKKGQIFGFKEEEVKALNLTTQTQKLSFVKTPAGKVEANQKQNQKQDSKPSNQTEKNLSDVPVWMMTTPQKGLAEEASIAYLLNLFATGQHQQTLTIPAAKRAEFGLDKPLAIAEVKLSNQQTHRLVLGKPNFDRSAIYAQADPPANPTGDLTVILVSMDFENAVTRPLSEWQAKEKQAGRKDNKSD
ncbi:DUF4340 domain-containing protein [Kovacikia minuta CCNUW1]|uniref:DUF4340 domain-containing protein n=1 Tax=Kovacikia minuta TaxID=2931930 RepID=UPI001CCBA6ED|nr:DUF4340 domain-containing protein [Kovacikia minuta]UBF28648.1 DUF4340 domain-containing protein [Kovacikia minuta CCNUW1]